MTNTLGSLSRVQMEAASGAAREFVVIAPVALPALATLRFRRVNAFFVLNLCRAVAGGADPAAADGRALPALRHLVFDHVGHAEMYWPLWAAAGATVRTAGRCRSTNASL